jgi:hypothetical protein
MLRFCSLSLVVSGECRGRLYGPGGPKGTTENLDLSLKQERCAVGDGRRAPTRSAALLEPERHWGLVEAQLGKGRYMVGGTSSIVDMSVWGWARAIPFIFGP